LILHYQTNNNMDQIIDILNMKERDPDFIEAVLKSVVALYELKFGKFPEKQNVAEFLPVNEDFEPKERRTETTTTVIKYPLNMPVTDEVGNLMREKTQEPQQKEYYPPVKYYSYEIEPKTHIYKEANWKSWLNDTTFRAVYKKTHNCNNRQYQSRVQSLSEMKGREALFYVMETGEWIDGFMLFRKLKRGKLDLCMYAYNKNFSSVDTYEKLLKKAIGDSGHGDEITAEILLRDDPKIDEEIISSLENVGFELDFKFKKIASYKITVKQ